MTRERLHDIIEEWRADHVEEPAIYPLIVQVSLKDLENRILCAMQQGDD